MIYHAVLTCATLLNLSMTTKMEMQHLLPQAAEYCMNHTDGKLSVAYGPIEKTQKMNWEWNRDAFEAYLRAKSKRNPFATGH